MTLVSESKAESQTTGVNHCKPYSSCIQLS